uniref:Glycine zipper 2TM domain-containing protein n=1 Tax=Heliothis virescens TaxID=7102 RepID=A0A2A4K3X1_HELVI
MDYDSDSGSDDGYEAVCTRGGRCGNPALPFDPASIENVILTISDAFDFRVILSDERTKGALLVTTGLALAGGLIGRHYGGKIGAAVGGAVGGACGLGIVAVSMRSIWEDIREKLSELFDIVYDYLAGMGLDDYKRAAMFLTQPGDKTQLAMIILQTASGILGKKILSSITAA